MADTCDSLFCSQETQLFVPFVYEDISSDEEELPVEQEVPRDDNECISNIIPKMEAIDWGEIIHNVRLNQGLNGVDSVNVISDCIDITDEDDNDEEQSATATDVGEIEITMKNAETRKRRHSSEFEKSVAEKRVKINDENENPKKLTQYSDSSSQTEAKPMESIGIQTLQMISHNVSVQTDARPSVVDTSCQTDPLPLDSLVAPKCKCLQRKTSSFDMSKEERSLMQRSIDLVHSQSIKKFVKLCALFQSAKDQVNYIMKHFANTNEYDWDEELGKIQEMKRMLMKRATDCLRETKSVYKMLTGDEKDCFEKIVIDVTVKWVSEPHCPIQVNLQPDPFKWMTKFISDKMKEIVDVTEDNAVSMEGTKECASLKREGEVEVKSPVQDDLAGEAYPSEGVTSRTNAPMICIPMDSEPLLASSESSEAKQTNSASAPAEEQVTDPVVVSSAVSQSLETASVSQQTESVQQDHGESPTIFSDADLTTLANIVSQAQLDFNANPTNTQAPTVSSATVNVPCEVTQSVPYLPSVSSVPQFSVDNPWQSNQQNLPTVSQSYRICVVPFSDTLGRVQENQLMPQGQRRDAAPPPYNEHHMLGTYRHQIHNMRDWQPNYQQIPQAQPLQQRPQYCTPFPMQGNQRYSELMPNAIRNLPQQFHIIRQMLNQNNPLPPVNSSINSHAGQLHRSQQIPEQIRPIRPDQTTSQRTPLWNQSSHTPLHGMQQWCQKSLPTNYAKNVMAHSKFPVNSAQRPIFPSKPAIQTPSGRSPENGQVRSRVLAPPRRASVSFLPTLAQLPILDIQRVTTTTTYQPMMVQQTPQGSSQLRKNVPENSKKPNTSVKKAKSRAKTTSQTQKISVRPLEQMLPQKTQTQPASVITYNLPQGVIVSHGAALSADSPQQSQDLPKTTAHSDQTLVVNNPTVSVRPLDLTASQVTSTTTQDSDVSPESLLLTPQELMPPLPVPVSRHEGDGNTFADKDPASLLKPAINKNTQTQDNQPLKSPNDNVKPIVIEENLRKDHPVAPDTNRGNTQDKGINLGKVKESMKACLICGMSSNMVCGECLSGVYCTLDCANEDEDHQCDNTALIVFGQADQVNITLNFKDLRQTKV
ncbi:uncharacterized protein LOC132261839 isoform X2 [Phlebotomus argentipes]|uniref:uncharacterized protein LOC132261839 isoform X2 n=1 Tax=Phlebotomus argentipes TaxID=94469 RepID=UPI002893636F|nr:uncharacterized protein LOC132261839 isoform X2 [Phlebotomus argentipes]